MDRRILDAAIEELQRITPNLYGHITFRMLPEVRDYLVALAKADQIEALPAEPLGDELDGGWAYVQRLFDRPVKGLAVPGRSPDGKQDIIISFKDGSTVHVSAHSLDEAWSMVAEAAEAMR